MFNLSAEGITAEAPLESLIQLSGDKAVIADGPLSLQFTNALNELYKKEVDAETGLVLESQANDEIVRKSSWAAFSSSKTKEALTNSGQSVGLLYGVQQSEASISDVVNVSEAISDMTEEEKDNSALILVTKVDASGTETKRYNSFVFAIEEIAKSNNVKVFTCLESYLATLKG